MAIYKILKTGTINYRRREAGEVVELLPHTAELYADKLELLSASPEEIAEQTSNDADTTNEVEEEVEEAKPTAKKGGKK